VLLVALVFSVYLNISDESLIVEELGSVSIAVLPFVNRSSDPEQEYFSDGISEELLNLLAKNPEFRVAGRTSSFAFKGKDDDLQAIGESLGVSSILEGSVRKSGERVRITAQLVNVNDGFNLWSDTYDRELTDIFGVQDEIGSAVVDELEVTLLGQTSGSSGPQNPINADAYNAYLQGIFYRNKVGPDNLKIAMSHFENAVVLEPDFASAWAELSAASAAYAGQTSEDAEEALLRGREAAARALELDSALPETHAALGYIQYFFDWDWDAAESSYRRALELRPGDVKARVRLARLIGDRGRIDESLNMLRSIMEADPLDQSLQLSYAARLFDNEDFEACESVITHLLELNPSMNFGSLFLAWVAMYEGRLDEALTMATAEPVDLGRWIALAMVQHRLGNRDAAIEAQQELLEAYGNLGAYQQAQIHAVWGDFDEAIRWLEIAYDAHDPGLTGLKIDFILRPLREHPGYIALLETMNL
jgi:serine/threonine-protein kinase